MEEYNLAKVMKISPLDLYEMEEMDYRKNLIIARLETKRERKK